MGLRHEQDLEIPVAFQWHMVPQRQFPQILRDASAQIFQWKRHLHCASTRGLHLSRQNGKLVGPLMYHLYVPFIWANYNISLTWIVRPFGDDFPNINHDSSEGEQWGRYMYHLCTIDVSGGFHKRGYRHWPVAGKLKKGKIHLLEWMMIFRGTPISGNLLKWQLVPMISCEIALKPSDMRRFGSSDMSLFKHKQYQLRW